MVPGRAETNYPPKGEMMGDVNSSEGDSSSFCVTDSLKLRLFQRGSVSISLPWIVFLKSRIFSFEKKAPGKSPNVFVPSISKLFSKNHRDLWERPISRFDGEKKTVRKVSPGHCQTERCPWTLEDLLRPHVPWAPFFWRKTEFPAMKSMKWKKKKYREKYLKKIHERHEQNHRGFDSEWMKRLHVTGHEIWIESRTVGCWPWYYLGNEKRRATLVLLLLLIEEILHGLIW